MDRDIFMHSDSKCVKNGMNLDNVVRASPSPTFLCPAGGHPWTGPKDGLRSATYRIIIYFI
jgi:hypothetical protein